MTLPAPGPKLFKHAAIDENAVVASRPVSKSESDKKTYDIK
tara:strand:- start:82 stop:204 length:123 start_codon:yes stop_codon:yes gene_type:complete